MNPLQMAQQVKHLLEQVTWPTGDEDLVFGARGSVAIFAGTPTDEQIPPGFPWCLVGMDGGEPDVDEPGLITYRFALIIASEVMGDRLGEHAIAGGAARNLGRSAGRGVAEVSERARRAVQNLTGYDGATALVSGVRAGPTTLLGKGRHLALEEFGLEAVCTSALHYAAPQELRYVSPTGGSSAGAAKWEWSGDHCAQRFDFFRYRLVRKAGLDPSKTPADGTVIYTGTAPQFVGARVNGQTYTVFADYCARGTSTVDGSSGPEVGAYRRA